MANTSLDIHAAAQTQPFNPWSLPDSFTIYSFAPEEIRSFLHPHWHNVKAPHPMWYYFFGLYYLVIGSMAFFGNVIVLRIFSRYDQLKTPANMLIMNLAVSDLTLTLAMMPECTFNFLSGGPWRFGQLACEIHAFMGALCGYNQIMTLCLISWDRYNVIVKGFSGNPLTFSKSIGLIIFSWIWALGWSVGPLVGWGHYAMDGMLGTCSYDSLTTTFSNKSHIMACFVFCFCIPFTSIVGCYYFIVQAVFKHEDELRQQAKKMNVTSLRSNADQDAVSAEIRAAKVAIMNVCLWVVAWIPFGAVTLMGTWGDTSQITPLINELPCVLAKTSCVYNPIIYALSHPKYRECLKELYPWMCIVVEKKKGNKNADNQSTNSTKTEVE